MLQAGLEHYAHKLPTRADEVIQSTREQDTMLWLQDAQIVNHGATHAAFHRLVAHERITPCSAGAQLLSLIQQQIHAAHGSWHNPACTILDLLPSWT